MLDGAALSVGAFGIETPRNTLTLGDREFRIEPLVMDVLCLLSSRPREVISRSEIIDSVWLTECGGDESLTRAIGQLRGVFAHDPDGGRYIETVWKRGYSLVAEVSWEKASDRTLSESLAPVRQSRSKMVPKGYAVAVLHFANASSGVGDAFLADGITRDLTMMLSRVPRLKVAAYTSAIRLQEGRDSLADISNTLDCRYVVSGSLSRAGPNFQLRVALMDAVDEAQVWAKRIDAPLTDFYRVQDRIILDISTSLASALQVSHVASISGRRPFQLNAYELVQRAEALRLKYNRDSALEIVDLLNRALALDPQDATVHAALAVQHTQNVVSSFVSDASDTFSTAQDHIERALALAPTDPEALAAAGVAATMKGDAEDAVAYLERANAIDPNNPHTLAVLGWQHCWRNGTREGIAMIERAEDRAPHHPRYSVWAHYRGHCEIRLGNIDAAVQAYRDGEARNPEYSLNLATLVAALELAGRQNEADAAADRLFTVSPAYRPIDLQILADRMKHWFGEHPSNAEFTKAFSLAWDRAEETRASG